MRIVRGLLGKSARWKPFSFLFNPSRLCRYENFTFFEVIWNVPFFWILLLQLTYGLLFYVCGDYCLESFIQPAQTLSLWDLFWSNLECCFVSFFLLQLTPIACFLYLWGLFFGVECNDETVVSMCSKPYPCVWARPRTIVERTVVLSAAWLKRYAEVFT